MNLPIIPDGWRLLGPQEVIEPTDMFWSEGQRPWMNFSADLGRPGRYVPYGVGEAAICFVPMIREIPTTCTLYVADNGELDNL
jgi:hypothetical protein